MLSDWRKLEEYNVDIKYEDAIIISRKFDFNKEVWPVIKTYIYTGEIVPRRIIKNKEVFEIIALEEYLVMNGFSVMLENELVDAVLIYGSHPNAVNMKFSLGEDRKKKFNKECFNYLISILRTYNLDKDELDFDPLQSIKYKKM